MSNSRNEEAGAQLRAAREGLGKTQSQVAVECGVTQPTVSDWESGKCTPSWERWPVVSSSYEFDVSTLWQKRAVAEAIGAEGNTEQSPAEAA